MISPFLRGSVNALGSSRKNHLPAMVELVNIDVVVLMLPTLSIVAVIVFEVSSV